MSKLKIAENLNGANELFITEHSSGFQGCGFIFKLCFENPNGQCH